jgi:hypothetical protein
VAKPKALFPLRVSTVSRINSGGGTARSND